MNSEPGERGVALACFSCEASHDIGSVQTVCTECGMPLRVDIALDTSLTPEVVIDHDRSPHVALRPGPAGGPPDRLSVSATAGPR